MGRRPTPEEERRKLFRRMEWVFVYGPPALIAFLGVFGAVFLAVVVPVPGTTFWVRWALGLLLLVALPGVAYLLREKWKNR